MNSKLNDHFNKQKKVIIIEGLDNIGKDTLISKICEKFPISTIIHCSKPHSEDPIESAKEQDSLFIFYATLLNREVFMASNCVIFNRYHMGEYVYGCIYRNRKPEDVLYMINMVDDILLKLYEKVYYIQMTTSNIDLILGNDDNNSISNNKKENVMKEREMFEEIFNKSKLNKLLLDVADKDGNFRSREDIFNDVVRFCEL